MQRWLRRTPCSSLRRQGPMDQPDDEAQPGPADCHSPGCRRGAVVYLAGRPLCSEHYLQNLNELNQLALNGQ